MPSRAPSADSRIRSLLRGRGSLPTWLFLDRRDVQYCARIQRIAGEIPADEMADRIWKSLNRLLRNPDRQAAERVCLVTDLPLSALDRRKLRAALRRRAESARNPQI